MANSYGEVIIECICNYYTINLEEYYSKLKIRKREFVNARQLTMFFLFEFTRYSQSKIGSLGGGKDHATAIHAKKTVINLIDTDKEYANTVDTLREIIKIRLEQFEAQQPVDKEKAEYKEPEFIKLRNITIEKRLDGMRWHIIIVKNDNKPITVNDIVYAKVKVNIGKELTLPIPDCISKSNEIHLWEV